MDIKIGDKFFASREYDRRNPYFPVVVIGEAARSWVLRPEGYGDTGHSDFKVPKKAPFSTRKIFTQQMIDEAAWMSKHGYRISSEVGRVHDYEKLKKIAEIVGYVE